jgi:hypothetical protein
MKAKVGSLKFILNGITAPTSRICLKELLWSGGGLRFRNADCGFRILNVRNI